MFAPWPHQIEGENLIRLAFATQSKSVLYVLPCGGGKTFLFASIAHSAARRGKRVLILCHRIELVDQITATLNDFDVHPDIIAAGYSRRAGGSKNYPMRGSQNPVTVASVMTMVRRLDDYPAPTLIIIDEAHHACAGSWSSILRRYPTAKVLGVTASPIRLDGHGLANYFDKMIVGPSVSELTEQGYLSPIRLFAPPTVDTSGLHMRMGDYKTDEAEALMDVPSITGDALAHYKNHANGRPALVFATSVAHAHHVAERFRADHIAALALDGNTDKAIRRMAVQDFRDGKIQVISQCEIATEGWDLPGVHCGIFLRPTQSLALWIQMTGRCSRRAPGKTHAILLDHVNNCRRLGMPDEDRAWQLTVDIIRKKRENQLQVRICPKCFAASNSRAAKCIECGESFENKSRAEIKQKDGELVELTAEEIARKKERREQGRARTLAELENFARLKNYRPGWARAVFEAREAKKREREEA